MLFGKIPFTTLADRHLVYAYLAVWIFHVGYGAWLVAAWRRSKS